MAEEVEGPEVGGEASSGLDPAATTLGLVGASRERADAFLKKQEALVDEQRHHLHRQYTQLDLGIWQLRLGVLLRIATAAIGIVVAAGLGYMIWGAAHSNDLVIDSFAVPPDLAARGLSGPVIAAKLSDKILAMQAETNSQRAPRSYANGLSEGLKLEIPETGVSLSELDRFLNDKLGHDQHIGGEIVQMEQGVALTARVGGDGSATVIGTDADMDTLLQKLAEQVYRITQPYRYAIWAISHRHHEEAVAVLSTLSATGPDSERAWAYNGWSVSTEQFQGQYAALALRRRSHALDPNNYISTTNIGLLEWRLGRTEDSLRHLGAALATLPAHGRDYATHPEEIERNDRALVLMFQGALLESVEEGRKAAVADPGIGSIAYPALLAELLAALHEPGAARAALVERPLVVPNTNNVGSRLDSAVRARLIIALEAQDWSGVLAAEKALPQLLAQYPGLVDSRPTMFDPLAALAFAHMGQFTAAEERLKTTPAECYPCLRARAQVAALQKQDARADFWFERAVAIGPSIPYAESEWGTALLERGQPDAAIEKFKLSHAKGPHFADPLEGWGEALMAKNQSHLALTKFAQAEKYAPNWGRLHLKWGEALFYAGKKEDARAQLQKASTLDLSAGDKAELARMTRS